MNDLLKELLDEIQVSLSVWYAEENNVYTFVSLSGSDSVKLIFDYMADLWYIEIFPINQNNEIYTVHFKDKDSAMKAFEVWQSYYLLVVKENFKMF